MAIIAKAIGVGAKLTAVAGREEVMKALLPRGNGAFAEKGEKVFQSGTYNDGTIVLAASIAAMKVYKKLNEKGEYQRLFQLTERLKVGIEMAFKRRGMPLHINILRPSLKLFFTNLEPSFDVYCSLDKSILQLFFISLINEGALLSWPSSGSVILSFTHTDGDIQRVIGAVNSSLDKNKFVELAGISS